MNLLRRPFAVLHGCMAALFAGMAILLMIIATKLAWASLANGLDRLTAQHIIESIGLLAAAVVALQIAQTITEEEVIRDANISGPTRLRRFLSRFLVVIIVALSVEGLVASFRIAHEKSGYLVDAASLVAAAGLLLAAWGLFIRLNRYAEEIEPEAMA